MQQYNIDKLEKYRSKLNLWINDKTCHLDGNAKNEILEVIRVEFNPGYSVDMWCGSCVVKMLEYAFIEMDKRKVDTIKVDLTPNYKKKK